MDSAQGHPGERGAILCLAMKRIFSISSQPARLAIEFKGPAEKALFLQDRKTQSAVLHQLLIIGEAVKRTSPEFRSANPNVFQ